jgi:type II secretory pathway pseudopilin PulG
VSKFLGFLLGVAVALAGPAVFGVIAAPGGIELNTKEMALAFGIGALIFWAVVSYFSGAGALGAFVAFGTLIYCWLWIPNRTTNFLNDVPGVRSGMIDGSKQYTLNGVVPILAIISLIYAIQLIVRSAQQRRRERAEAERLQREQEAAQAQQDADAAALYPVAGSTYPEAGYADSYSGGNTRFEDLFDEPEAEPVQPRNQADEQTAQYPATADPEQTALFPPDPEPEPEPENISPFAGADAQGNDPDETVLVPTDPEATQERQTPAELREAPEATNEPAAPEGPDGPEAPEATEEPEAPAVTEEQQSPEAKAPEEPEAAKAAEEAQAPEANDEPEAAEAKDEQKAPEPKAQEVKAEPKVQPNQPPAATREQLGSQYRERMEDPEDTGEFHLTAFDNPVVKPA